MQVVFKIFDWYRVNKRDLPWRNTRDAYKIWLSEIILQQTQVRQGLPYYERFVERFPTVFKLAEADEDSVLKLWQGLGYYSRARNLHAAAQQVVSQYNGVFPTDYKSVLSLKGVGEYTAAAIVSLAYNQPYPVLDGNVYRVISRLFGITVPINTPAAKKVIYSILNDLIPHDHPDIFNSAMMEFGALHCKPDNPMCHNCPFSMECYALTHNMVKQLPVKQAKQAVKSRYFNYFDIEAGSATYMKKRSGKDIWHGLYEFPLAETDKALTVKEAQVQLDKLLVKGGCVLDKEAVRFTHKLTHQTIYATFWKARETAKAEFSDHTMETITESKVIEYPVHRLLEKYLLHLP